MTHALKGKLSRESMAYVVFTVHDIAMKHKAFTAHFPSGNDGFEGKCSTCREKNNMLINNYMSL